MLRLLNFSFNGDIHWFFFYYKHQSRQFTGFVHRHSNSGPLFPHLVPPAIMVWIFVWKYIFEPFIHILQHFVLQLSRSTNFCF